MLSDTASTWPSTLTVVDTTTCKDEADVKRAGGGKTEAAASPAARTERAARAPTPPGRQRPSFLASGGGRAVLLCFDSGLLLFKARYTNDGLISYYANK